MNKLYAPEISVIMSIYNETFLELKEAVYSILSQSFTNFEFIIVIDNPNRRELRDYLEVLDSRICVILNEKNIGLAQSMNKAADFAHSGILARMDADDISLQTRLQEEYETILKNNYSLVCCGYKTIREDGSEIGFQSPQMSDYEMVHNLTYTNTIHHPTVMLKKDVFNKVGGYRNFPCSQDYDLWLRIREIDCNMHHINKHLFLYRIREQSISQSNKVKQLTTWWYIQTLYKKRCNKGHDDFSEINYEEFLKRQKVYCKKYLDDAKKAQALMNEIDALKYKKGKRLIRLSLMVRVTLMSEFYRKRYRNILWFKINQLINKMIKVTSIWEE